MPELPEVECVRRGLVGRLLGRRVASVRVGRSDVITGGADDSALLVGQRLAEVRRHGKQLALIGDRGSCVAVHLGMSGQLCVLPNRVESEAQVTTPVRRTHTAAGSCGGSAADFANLPPHTHVLWRFEGGPALRFTDPRRFGGLWTFDHVDRLTSERWSSLGPDALHATAAPLHKALRGTTRPIKAALLDQTVLAGLGNIYVDELLFGARIHPLQPANTLGPSEAASLARRMRTLLARAIDAGGSTLRDYVDANDHPGGYQHRHRVYGRAGRPCARRPCGAVLTTIQVAGRSTVFCPVCQLPL